MTDWTQACMPDDIDVEGLRRLDHQGRTFAVYRSAKTCFPIIAKGLSHQVRQAVKAEASARNGATITLERSNREARIDRRTDILTAAFAKASQGGDGAPGACAHDGPCSETAPKDRTSSSGDSRSANRARASPVPGARSGGVKPLTGRPRSP